MKNRRSQQEPPPTERFFSSPLAAKTIVEEKLPDEYSHFITKKTEKPQQFDRVL
jgi:hypothetical protein